jgi:hypothetical protein
MAHFVSVIPTMRVKIAHYLFKLKTLFSLYVKPNLIIVAKGENVLKRDIVFVK